MCLMGDFDVKKAGCDYPALLRLAGLEPATYGLEIRCSIQLSYRRAIEGTLL